jgi:hypothetical protein
MKHLLDLTLTQPDSEFTQQLRQSVPGMAHFAGTGPSGATCGGCDYFRSSKRGTRCAKFTELMRQAFPSGRAPAEGGDVPRATPACRYFLARPK